MSERIQNKFSPSIITDDGRFSGYGAVFGNVDSHRDVIERGAFLSSLAAWKTRGKLPPMRLMHGSAGNPFQHDDLPVGKWLDMREDTKGLWVEGQLLALDTDQGRRLRSLMAASCLDGLSIGWIPRKTRAGTGRIKRYLVEVDLRELSLVDEPSNDLARVAPLSSSDMAFERLRDSLATVKTATSSNYEAAAARLRTAIQRVAAEQK
ncbi:HK97 family phage prohead protease [Neorhizobium alkalisoli]|uniref:HK97 family phage prohead protease n=1 Tax=Neorhizobium alkalisoli TaxID=528178 RepID=A0A561QSL1_9HYPH|nr:HK97 family phage prohead protease [Neorhizobium alkalisoli]TWF53307.1 HK97 family phage prohead protease [Neorhizobium alkalisoli]